MKNDIIIINVYQIKMEYVLYPEEIYEYEEAGIDNLIKDITHYIGEYIVKTFIFIRNGELWVSHWEKNMKYETKYYLIYENTITKFINYYKCIQKNDLETFRKILEYKE